MTVTIQTGNWARQFLPETTVLTLTDGAVVSDALSLLPIPRDEIGLTAVDGCVAADDRALRDGDIIEILPVIIGG